jgi:hypothetical protein
MKTKFKGLKLQTWFIWGYSEENINMNQLLDSQEEAWLKHR